MLVWWWPVERLHFTFQIARNKPVPRIVMVQTPIVAVTSDIVELLRQQGIRRPFTPQTVQPKLVLQTVMDLMQSAFVISDTVAL